MTKRKNLGAERKAIARRQSLFATGPNLSRIRLRRPLESYQPKDWRNAPTEELREYLHREYMKILHPPLPWEDQNNG